MLSHVWKNKLWQSRTGYFAVFCCVSASRCEITKNSKLSDLKLDLKNIFSDLNKLKKQSFSLKLDLRMPLLSNNSYNSSQQMSFFNVSAIHNYD